MTGKHPTLLYDNDCSLCSKFARIVGKSSKGWVHPVGLFTEEGRMIKSGFFRAEDRPDDMFWLLYADTGYGGRNGLVPLLREIVRGRILS